MVRNIFGWVVFVVLTALYGYLVVAAVGNLTQLPQMASALGLGVNALGWFWLWLWVTLPIVGYVIAVLVGRKRRGGSRLLIFVTALAALAALQLEFSIVVPPTSFFM